VTFGQTGAVVKIVIEAPPGLSSQAVACLGERIGTASVPPFEDGGDGSVAATWVVL
jgi:hypothetical protein